MHLKVLHVYKDFEPDAGGGGVARHISGLAESADGIQVTVVAPLADCRAGRGLYQVHQSGLAGLFANVLDADIVHIHGARTFYSAMAGLMAVVAGRKLVYTPHCYYEDDRVLKSLLKKVWDSTVERTLLAFSDSVILLSEYWLQYLSDRGLKVTKPVVVPNCVIGAPYRSVPSQLGKLEGAPSILSVGRLDKVKRIEDVLEALNRPGLEHAFFHIVGRGPDRDRLVELAAALGVVNRVRFYGFVDDEAMMAMARKADVFVLASAYEGMPTVLIEMIMMGTPVVASEIPGNLSILDRVGLMSRFPVSDSQALALAVISASRARLSPLVMDIAWAEFSWESQAPKIVNLYRRLCHAT